MFAQFQNGNLEPGADPRKESEHVRSTKRNTLPVVDLGPRGQRRGLGPGITRQHHRFGDGPARRPGARRHGHDYQHRHQRAQPGIQQPDRLFRGQPLESRAVLGHGGSSRIQEDRPIRHRTFGFRAPGDQPATGNWGDEPERRSYG